VVRVGTRSRALELTARVTCRGRPEISESAASVLESPLLAVSARGTVVVPAAAGGP
jgi:3-aminobutyryl-CoA ammonia-lyase